MLKLKVAQKRLFSCSFAKKEKSPIQKWIRPQIKPYYITFLRMTLLFVIKPPAVKTMANANNANAAQPLPFAMKMLATAKHAIVVTATKKNAIFADTDISHLIMDIKLRKYICPLFNTKNGLCHVKRIVHLMQPYSTIITHSRKFSQVMEKSFTEKVKRTRKLAKVV